MPIAFEELEGSPRVTINEQGTTAQRRFRVAWDDWQTFARTLVGTYRVLGGATQFVPPIQFPGLPNLIVTDLTVEPFDPRNPDGSAGVTLGAHTNAYPAAGALVSAVYRTAYDFDNRSRSDLPSVPEGTILTYRADLGVEYQTTPGRTWRWNAAGDPRLPEDIRPGVMAPTGSFELIWSRVLLPPWSAIRGLRGRVNDATFVGGPAGTVLFLGARATRQFQFLEGGGFWKLEYQFAEQSKPLVGGGVGGWNHFFRELPIGGEQWLPIKDVSGNAPIPARASVRCSIGAVSAARVSS
jgi:hypothetical protein